MKDQLNIERVGRRLGGLHHPAAASRPDGNGLPGRKSSRHRSRNISDAAVSAIVALIRQMPGKPDWAGVIEVVAASSGHVYTRQALSRHPAVKLALQDRRRGAAAHPGRRARSSVLQSARATVERQRRDLEALKGSYETVVLQLQRCVYHARGRGMTLDEIDAPLPAIDRR